MGLPERRRREAGRELRKEMMDKDPAKVRKDLKKLLQSQPLAVLSTQGRGQPYASLVAFASSRDLRRLYFATSRSTRKYANILGDSRVAMLADNRSNTVSDFRWATAATATGRAVEVEAGARDEASKLFLAKHPDLEKFIQSPGCALCEIQVETYFVVTRFQSVVEVPVRKANR
jgi:nitroimidazol reductase NimA-like FMN-containing flavoprotein (pyridoxamine 5'-phosphate oxidase superfamily)